MISVAKERLTDDHRLKHILGLPKILPRPPCPPRLYQKLYRYFDTVLPEGTKRRGRPAKLVDQDVAPTSSSAKSRTPIKQIATRQPTSRKKALQYGGPPADVPAWIMPTIRHLCTKMNVPAAPPHVYAGVCSVLTLPPPIQLERQDSSTIPAKRDKVQALIIIVYFFVALRLSGSKIENDEYNRQRDLAIRIVTEIEIPDFEKEELEGKDVDTWLVEIRDRGWFSLDWYTNVKEVGTSIDDPSSCVSDLSDMEITGPENENSMGQRHSSEINNKALYAGLGTMVSVLSLRSFDFHITLQQLSEKVDYLSQHRRAEYSAWKANILKRIDELEREHKRLQQHDKASDET